MMDLNIYSTIILQLVKSLLIFVIIIYQMAKSAVDFDYFINEKKLGVLKLAKGILKQRFYTHLSNI